jgi:hypothetical protein
MERIPTLFEQEAKRMSALNKHKHMNSDKSAGAAFLAVIGIFALVCLLWLYGIFAYGFVAVKLWAWFVVPVFHTEYSFGILQAAGLFMFVRFFTQNYNIKVNSQDERPVTDKIAEIFIPIIVPWMTLGLAWILKSML